MRGLNGKVAIVTGGAGRIGVAVVRRLVEEGARVAVADLREDAARRVSDEFGDRAMAIRFDSADEASIERMVKVTIDRFGRLDILHNNAAYVSLGELGEDTDVLRTPLELWDLTMSVNLRGYMLACRYALPRMIAGGGGSIINMSSGSGLLGDAVRVAYGTSKAAIASLTRYVATQHGKQGVRCNAISPGLIADTTLAQAAPKLVALNVKHALTPRGGHPDDVAGLVAFLGSDDSGFITGQNICIDGGSLAHVPQWVDSMELDSAYS
jgi:NAD(P)-dependent dehydrogenase (short-subunit alcohol dehydrogenase family)